MVVEGRDRLAVEDPIVGEVRIGRDGPATGDLEVDPVAWSSRIVDFAEARDEPPRRSCWSVGLADVGQLHRRAGDVGSIARV
jgi:hypothetical protein